MKPRKLLPEHDPIIRRMRHKGARVVEIAAVIGVSRSTIQTACRRLGLPARLPRRSQRFSRATVYRMLREGKTHAQIAAHLKSTQSAVKQFIHRTGLDYLSAPEVPVHLLAAELGVSPSGLKWLIAQGTLAANRHGRMLMADAAQEAAIRAHYAARTPAPRGYVTATQLAERRGITHRGAWAWLNRRRDTIHHLTVRGAFSPVTYWSEQDIRRHTLARKEAA